MSKLGKLNCFVAFVYGLRMMENCVVGFDWMSTYSPGSAVALMALVNLGKRVSAW